MIDDFEEILRRASRTSRDILAQLGEGTSEQVRAILDVIGENFCVPRYTSARLQNDARLSYRQLMRFRAAVGMPVSRLIRECRLETAFYLLRETLVGVEHIAILVGFDCTRSLERLCRRGCGLNPSELRARLRSLKHELAELPDQVFSWYFWEQYRHQALSDEVIDGVIVYLERRGR